MEFVCARARELPPALYDALAVYRFQVFVERLGWELPSAPGYEQDEFDHADTVHLVARDASGAITGCGRLLPTTGPYLLESVFPELFNGLEIPRDAGIWELSRFAAMPTQAQAETRRRDYLAERVLLRALRYCAERGVSQLLAVSTPPVERLLQRAGVRCRRLGPPIVHAGQAILAFVMQVDASSLQALEAFERRALEASTRAPAASPSLPSWTSSPSAALHLLPARLPRVDPHSSGGFAGTIADTVVPKLPGAPRRIASIHA